MTRVELGIVVLHGVHLLSFLFRFRIPRSHSSLPSGHFPHFPHGLVIASRRMPNACIPG